VRSLAAPLVNVAAMVNVRTLCPRTLRLCTAPWFTASNNPVASIDNASADTAAGVGATPAIVRRYASPAAPLL
jgi:hypothetical protein